METREISPEDAARARACANLATLSPTLQSALKWAGYEKKEDIAKDIASGALRPGKLCNVGPVLFAELRDWCGIENLHVAKHLAILEDDLEQLESKREEIRKAELLLTERIKRARAEIAAQKQAEKRSSGVGVSMDKYRKLRSENKRLIGLVAAYEVWQEGSSFKRVAEKLGVSAQHARDAFYYERKYLLSHICDDGD